MKKIFLLSVLFAAYASYAQPPVKGRIKLYLHSVRCDKETADDLFDGDGKGDEIFITVFYSVAGNNGFTKYINKVSTGIYGDNRNWPARVKAGSAGTTGGIKAGDMVYVNPQTEERMPAGDERFKGLLVIDTELEAGDILTIIPVLSEWDGNPANTQNSFESYLWNSFNNVNVHMAGFTQRFDMKTANRIFGDKGAGCFNINGLTQLLQPVNGWPGNRPIGMAQNGSYDPYVFVFNSVILENWTTLMQPYSNNYTGNNLSISYDEPMLGNNRDHGRYALMIFPEFIKSPQAITPANNYGVNRPPKPVTIKDPNGNMTLATNKSLFTGTWTGTQTNDYGLYPQAIDFELTSNNEFLIKARSTGSIAARGTYTLTGTSISGSYKLFSSSEMFSFIGNYDTNTQQMLCTLGSGTATTGQGKWVVKKN